MLSLVSSVFDPFGFLSPFILKAKLLFQNLCRRKIQWDEHMPEDVLNQWKCWQRDLNHIKEFSVSRCVAPVRFKVKHAQLHHFCDASQQAYAAVSYLKLTSFEENVHVSFLLAKSKLAPLKTVTIPRLELSAALEATKLDEIIKRELEIQPLETSIFWTDSEIVLWYLNNTTRTFKTFVAN